MNEALPLLAVIFAAIASLASGLMLLVLNALRSGVQELKTEMREDFRATRDEFKAGSSRFRELEREVAEVRGGLEVIARVCELNHGASTRRATDPPDADRRNLRCNDGERAG